MVIALIYTTSEEWDRGRAPRLGILLDKNKKEIRDFGAKLLRPRGKLTTGYDPHFTWDFVKSMPAQERSYYIGQSWLATKERPDWYINTTVVDSLRKPISEEEKRKMIKFERKKDRKRMAIALGAQDAPTSSISEAENGGGSSESEGQSPEKKRKRHRHRHRRSDKVRHSRKGSRRHRKKRRSKHAGVSRGHRDEKSRSSRRERSRSKHNERSTREASDSRSLKRAKTDKAEDNGEDVIQMPKITEEDIKKHKMIRESIFRKFTGSIGHTSYLTTKYDYAGTFANEQEDPVAMAEQGKNIGLDENWRQVSKSMPESVLGEKILDI
eukprot:CAMPEP_0114503658 /NCGR_PEP_ID=MMETSP0109-20121206/9769_1 /TAXON_ID=29199 /ORGANISM="Chlorarachnion reptans, Strain CCCM449" /LENGTH=324 /DNA_ID=CAMNT_0001681709 /DNA_START=52 /DNA_END=1026 /DNA_ORIENTATION=-